MKRLRLFIYVILVMMIVPVFVNAESLYVTDCDNNKIYTTIPSNLKGLAKIMAQNAYLDNGQSEYINSCSGVDFNNISSNTNGKGIYEIASTKNDTYPIYYYRGAVTNNNVKFGGFCWKAIRTTDTGGVKLIYNGEPDQDGYCTNTTGTSTQIRKRVFNVRSQSPADVGYMYGTRYEYSEKAPSNLVSPYVYGNDVTYSDGKYTLINTMTSTGTWSTDYNTLNNNHYTCFSTGTTCGGSVYYVYHTKSSALYVAYYIVLRNGNKVEDALNEMFNGDNVNESNSSIKNTIDNWYNTNLSSYTNYIEDTLYCNDRSIGSLGGWDPNGGNTLNNRLSFSPYTRTFVNHSPSLACNRLVDRFTVSESIGNGKLTYPIGLITGDEIMYAGGHELNNNSTYYLYTNLEYWSMSPGEFDSFSGDLISVGSSGRIGLDFFNDTDGGLRPVISLSPSTSVVSGNGTSTNPYLIDFYYSISIEDNNKTEDIDIDVDDISAVEPGRTVTFRITPIDNYVLDSIEILDKNNNQVSYNPTGNENEYSFTMPSSNVTIAPSYKKNKFKVNISIENETEDININVDNISSVLVGENVVFKVTPIKGYKINNIRIIDSNNNEVTFNSTGTNNEYSFVMPESDVTIIPSYEKVSNSVNVEDNKNTKEIIIEVNDSRAVVYDDIVVFRIDPDDGYEISNIIIIDENNNKIKYEKTSNKNEYRFIMPDTNVFIKPIYKKIETKKDNNIIDNPKTGMMIIFIIMLLLSICIISKYIVKKVRYE